MDGTLVDVHGDDALCPPAGPLAALRGVKQVVTIKDAPIEGVACGHLLDELTFCDIVPWFLNHLVTELAHEPDVCGLGFKRLVVDLTKDVGVGSLCHVSSMSQIKGFVNPYGTVPQLSLGWFDLRQDEHGHQDTTQHRNKPD